MHEPDEISLDNAVRGIWRNHEIETTNLRSKPSCARDYRNCLR